jgi:molybdopterin/thiamine biosynthesis adenylyltransferase
MLSEQQIERYSRQIILPQLGGRGQQALLSATLAIAGRPDLSSVAATYVAAAGVGTLALSAAQLPPGIEELNPDCHISTLPVLLTEAVAQEMARRSHVVLACGATRDACTLLDAACVAQHTPLVWGDASGALGLVAILAGGRRELPCYTCVQAHLSRLLAAADASHPLASSAAAFIGTLQATEAIKTLIGLGASETAQVLTYDAAAGMVGATALVKDPRCPTCGAHRA